jgi:hypothetical protein
MFHIIRVGVRTINGLTAVLEGVLLLLEERIVRTKMGGLAEPRAEEAVAAALLASVVFYFNRKIHTGNI